MFYRKVIILLILTGILPGLGATSWAAPLESFLPKEDLPKEWAMVEGPQRFTKKTLFERINGQAELFYKYGFQKSVFAVYQDQKSREDQMEADIYEMASVLQAFGVFSRFRNEDRPGGFGLDSFLDDHSALFYQGKYFVMLYAPEPSQPILSQFSKLISLKISDPSHPPKEINYFPKKGLKPGSIQYFPEGLMGHQFLKRGFQGTYTEKVGDEKKVGGKAEVEGEEKAKTRDEEFKLFLALFRDPQEAMNALKVYKGALSKQGKVSSGGVIEFQTSGLKGEDPYQGKVMVVQKGFCLLGVVGFEKEEEAAERLAEFMKNVK